MKKTLGIIVFIVILLLMGFLAFYSYDLYSFNNFEEDYQKEYQLVVNGETIAPSIVEGETFVFQEQTREAVDVQIPNNSTLNLLPNYELKNQAGEVIEGEITYLQDGKYTLTQTSDNYTYIYDLVVDNDFSVAINQNNAYQAGYYVVSFYDLNSDEEVIAEPSFTSSDSLLFKETNMLIPIDYHNEGGIYNITFKSEKSETVSEVEIMPMTFREVHFTVDTDVVAGANEAPDPEVEERYNQATYEIKPEALYTTFQIPATGYTTGDFGDIRFINGVTEPNAYHYGIDYADVLNTPIYSTAAGEVTFSGFLPMTGGTMIVNHGNGVTSQYVHLNDILLNEGDIVDTNTPIALMGTTGFSTGVHLHFEIRINGMPINPYLLLNKELDF